MQGLKVELIFASKKVSFHKFVADEKSESSYHPNFSLKFSCKNFMLEEN